MSNHKQEGSIYNGYTLGKNDFMQEIVKLTGFNGLRFVICTHYTELETAKAFRQKYFFDKAGITDPYHWTFNHPEHEHLMLYLGTQIIGYAHIVLWQDMRAGMRIIVIDEPYRKQGLGAKFLALIEKYLRMKGFKSLHAESSPAALGFYRKEGYVDVPFDDPGGYESDEKDTPVGKILRSGNR
jgi:GNAT superfamily N-acetyltransferase